MSRPSGRVRDASLEGLLAGVGMIRIEQPMPFGPESANLYLGLGPPPFLIDTGLPEAGGWDMDKALARHGVRTDDVAHVFLTHAHIDHAGSARRFSERTRATIWAHPGETPRLDGRQFRFLQNQMPDLLRRLGFDRPVLDRFLASIAAGIEVYRRQVIERFEPLENGARLPVEGLDVEVIHTPGHSQGSVCFLERSAGLLFSGDTLLPGGPPRAVVSPSGESEIAFDGLMELERSLEVLRSRRPEAVFAGHGPPVRFGRTAALAEKSFQSRRDLVLRTLRPGATLFDLIRDKADGPPVLFLMQIGETRATVEALMAEGRLRMEITGGVERYYPV